MTGIEIRLSVTDPLCTALQGLAERRGDGIREVLRALLSKGLEQAQDGDWGDLMDVKSQETTEIIRQQVLLDLGKAHSWPELQGRLMLRGCVLRDGPSGLAVCCNSDGSALWTLESLEVGRDALEQRMGAGFPDRTTINWGREVVALHHADRQRTDLHAGTLQHDVAIEFVDQDRSPSPRPHSEVSAHRLSAVEVLSDGLDIDPDELPDNDADNEAKTGAFFLRDPGSRGTMSAPDETRPVLHGKDECADLPAAGTDVPIGEIMRAELSGDGSDDDKENTRPSCFAPQSDLSQLRPAAASFVRSKAGITAVQDPITRDQVSGLSLKSTDPSDQVTEGRVAFEALQAEEPDADVAAVGRMFASSRSRLGC